LPAQPLDAGERTHGLVVEPAPAIPLPGVYAPEHAVLLGTTATANLAASGGFEGMALNASGNRLYTLLEKTVNGDAPKTLRIDEFDLASESYSGTRYLYALEAEGTAIGDMTAVDDERFIVIERNGGTTTAAPAPFKRLYLVDLRGMPAGGTVKKTELVDLMNVPDPHDLNADGSTTYTMPYVTIEDVLVLDARTLRADPSGRLPDLGRERHQRLRRRSRGSEIAKVVSAWTMRSTW
jgi:hypothetical protein